MESGDLLVRCTYGYSTGRQRKNFSDLALIETLNLLRDRGVDFIGLTEDIDTLPPSGKRIFHLMGALAEYERDLIRERTKAGLAAAKARGRVGGRPRKTGEGKVALGAASLVRLKAL